MEAHSRGGFRHGKLPPHRDFILKTVAGRCDITMPELAAVLLAEKAITVAPATLSRFLIACGFSFKKTLRASEQDRPDLIQARAEWKQSRQPKMREHRGRLIFLDETSTSTKMTKATGRCPKGGRFFAKAPFGHWGTQTLIVGLKSNGLVAPWVINAPMNRVIFDTYVETQLAPILMPGDVVILDNLAAHKSEGAENIVRAKGASILFLPPPSFDGAGSAALTSTQSKWLSPNSNRGSEKLRQEQ